MKNPRFPDMEVPLAAALAFLMGWLFTCKTPGMGRGQVIPWNRDFAHILSGASYLSLPP